MKNLLFIFLALNAISPKSNLDCITKTLSSYYKSTHASPKTPKSNERRLAGNQITTNITNGEENQKIGIETLSNIKINHYNLVRQVYSDILSVKDRRTDFLVYSVCVPYMLENEVHVVPAEVHCSKLAGSGVEEIEFMLKYERLGQKVFGSVFKESMMSLAAKYPNKTVYDKVDMKDGKTQGQVTEEKSKQYREKYDEEFKIILKHFRMLFSKKVDDLVMDNMRMIFKIGETIKKVNKDAEAIEMAILLPLVEYYDNDTYKLVKGIQSIVKTHPELLSNKPYSRAFYWLPEMILPSTNTDYSYLSNFLHLELGPLCYRHLVANNVTNPVTTCQELLNSAVLQANSEESEFFRLASNSRTFVNDYSEKIEALIKDYGVAYTDTYELIEEIENTRDEFIEEKKRFVEDTLFETSDFNADIPLYLDLEDLLRKIPEKVYDYFSEHNELDTFHSFIQNNYYFDDITTKYVNDLREKIMKYSKQEKPLKIDQFVEKLKKKCAERLSDDKASLCKLEAAMVDYSDLVPYRHFDYIFEIIVMTFDKKISSYNLQASQFNELRDIMYNHMQENSNYLRTFIQKQKEELNLTMQLNHKKLGNTVTAALFGEFLTGKDWTEYILPKIEEWYDLNKQKLKESGNHDEVFGGLLKDLVDLILAEIKQPVEEIDLIQDSLYELTEDDISDLIDNMETLLLHYNSWSDDLKLAMDQCALNQSTIPAVFETCEKEAGKLHKSCEKLNPFVLRQSCGLGYTFNHQHECVAECPTGFYRFNDSYCLKPEVYSLNRNEAKETKCKPLHRQFAHLCVPVCPLGWTDHGSWCQRPRHAVKHYLLVQ